MRISPGGNAARSDFGVLLRGINPRVINPATEASDRIECNHSIIGRAQKECPIYKNWSRFESSFFSRFIMIISFARAIGPGHVELVNVLSIDLSQRRIARTSGVATIARPTVRGRGKAFLRRAGRDDQRNEEKNRS